MSSTILPFPMLRSIDISIAERGGNNNSLSVLSSQTKTHVFVDERKEILVQQAKTYVMLYKATKQKHYLVQAKELVEKVKQWEMKVAA